MSSTSSGAQEECVCPKVVIIAVASRSRMLALHSSLPPPSASFPACAGVAFNDDVEPCGDAPVRDDTRAACATLLPFCLLLPSPASLSSSVSTS
ncbi:hypothetical protein MTO96_031586 [Rhipicephalus appendiculatus]